MTGGLVPNQRRCPRMTTDRRPRGRAELRVAHLEGHLEALQAQVAALEAAEEHRRSDEAHAEVADAWAEAREAQGRAEERRHLIDELREQLAGGTRRTVRIEIRRRWQGIRLAGAPPHKLTPTWATPTNPSTPATTKASTDRCADLAAPGHAVVVTGPRFRLRHDRRPVWIPVRLAVSSLGWWKIAINKCGISSKNRPWRPSTLVLIPKLVGSACGCPGRWLSWPSLPGNARAGRDRRGELRRVRTARRRRRPGVDRSGSQYARSTRRLVERPRAGHRGARARPGRSRDGRCHRPRRRYRPAR